MMPWLRRSFQHVGYRGTFLAAFGGVYILIGFSYLDIPSSAVPAVRKSLRVALEVAPLSFYAWAWIVAGIIAVWSGLFTITSERRPIGFAVSVMMPTLWAIVNLTEWVKHDNSRGWVGCSVYALLAVAVATVAGMLEPRNSRP
jgi:hypothetical protein